MPLPFLSLQRNPFTAIHGSDPLLYIAKSPQFKNKLKSAPESLPGTSENSKLQTGATGGNMKCEHARKHSL